MPTERALAERRKPPRVNYAIGIGPVYEERGGSVPENMRGHIRGYLRALAPAEEDGVLLRAPALGAVPRPRAGP